MNVRRKHEMRLTSLIAVAGVSLLPVVASAQSPADLAYCRALSDIYVRYIGWDELYSDRGIRRRANIDAQVALAKCRQGRDTAWAIPILERELIANRFTLPARG
jgi:hypothetical protein